MEREGEEEAEGREEEEKVKQEEKEENEGGLNIFYSHKVYIESAYPYVFILPGGEHEQKTSPKIHFQNNLPRM